MGEQRLAEESPIESPRHWPRDRLMAEVERVELRISMAKEAGFSGVVDVVTIQAAKLSLYSNELARRASDRAAAAADRASRSTRFLAVAAIFGSVILGIAQIVVTFTQRAK